MTPDPVELRTPEGVSPATGMPVVIKIGGRSLEAPGAPEELAAEVASLSGETLLVHGGGREVSDWCAKQGITSRFVDGLRVTDPATLEVATAVLAGLANKRLVALLRDAGVDAVGLSALDGGLLEVEPHPDTKTLGAVGRVTSVDATLLHELIDAGRVPVVASIGAHRGKLLNLNADEVAAALAVAIEAKTLVLLSDTPGVKVDGNVVPLLTAAEIDALLSRDDAKDGMVAKLKAARQALDAGIARVQVAAWSGPGTIAGLLSGMGWCTTLYMGETEQVH